MQVVQLTFAIVQLTFAHVYPGLEFCLHICNVNIRH